MEIEMEIASSSEPMDLEIMQCRLNRVEEIYRTCSDDSFSETPSSGSEQLLKHCAHQLEMKVQHILSEYSDAFLLGIEDLDTFVENWKDDLNTTKAESARIAGEIEALTSTNLEDSTRLERDIEMLRCSLDLISSQELVECGARSHGEDQLKFINEYEDQKLEILKLDDQIEKRKIMLKSMQDLDSAFKRLDIIEQIEDALSGLRVIEFDGSCIRLSMQSFVPKFKDIACPHVMDDIVEQSEVNHEFLIEVVTGTMELKNVEMFPNDVHIGDITDAAKSFRQFHSQLALLERRSSLEWFLKKVQDRIIQCTLRRLVIKHANNSRHSLEYLDRDETIVAHLVGGIDAFMKVPHGWPLSPCQLRLISLRSSAQHSKDISLSFLCRIEELANSLDVDVRQNLYTFVDAVEKALVEQMRLELHADDSMKA